MPSSATNTILQGNTSPPVFADTTNQNFYIEPLGGVKDVIAYYMQNFPDTVYNKSPHSLLVKFLSVLVGPAGAGLIQDQLLAGRLEFEGAGLYFNSLDQLYNNALGFLRAYEESYRLDAESALLPFDQRLQILAQDASFRNRCLDFIQGIRAGATTLGIESIARSALTTPVTVTETWKSIINALSDRPLTLGNVNNSQILQAPVTLNEIIISPQNDLSQTSVQTIQFEYPLPTSGTFSLYMPGITPWLPIAVYLTNNLPANTPVDLSIVYPIITQLNESLPKNITYQSPAAIIYNSSIGTRPPVTTGLPAYSNINSSALSVINGTVSYTIPANVVQFETPSTIDLPEPLPSWAYLGLGVIGPFPYNATSEQIQTQMNQNPLLYNNVVVSGGPLPNNPVQITFQNALANQYMPPITVNTDPDNLSGSIGLTGSATCTTSIQTAYVPSNTIQPQDMWLITQALQHVLPENVNLNFENGASSVLPVSIQSVYNEDSYVEVIRYETGQPKVPWPPVDQTHWIQANVENEAPRYTLKKQQQYTHFHNVSNIMAYTEKALLDPLYNDLSQVSLTQYWDSQIGNFSPAQVAIAPILGAYQNSNTTFLPQQALAPVTEHLDITDTIDGTAIVDNFYPLDYLNLPNITPLNSSQSFWASLERSSGTDYLEIDLGSVQAVNFITFEATGKPYSISIDFDLLDMYPNREFAPIITSPAVQGMSTTSIIYQPSSNIAWQPIQILFSNSNGGMIYTRFIRLGFIKDAPPAPLITPTGVLPFSIEVRNLRIGRNVNS